jgi:pimeloyl-ACP methyl ester carboxylesterase
MRASGVPLTVAVGAEDRDSWFGAASASLAEGTGAELVELPGGHAGLLTHPEALVELVRGIARR